MATDGDFNQAFQSFSRRENLPAALTSEEWSSVPSEIRERAFFMSRVTDAEILQQFRDETDAVVRNERSVNDAEKRLFMWLEERGYQPPEGKAGGLEDLSSLARINVVLQTNRDMARGHADWVRSQTAIRGFPAQELVRIKQAKEPRNWPALWAEAKAELADIPGVHPTRMIALLNHPIWRKISRFDQPWPPFDFGSGMGVTGISRTEALELGMKLDPNTDPMQKPIHRTMNDGLEVAPQVSDPVLKLALADKLGRFGEMQDGKLVFTDPDGSKPATAAKLAEIWAKPAPAGYDRLTQKDALDAWAGGQTPDAQDARIILRKLFDRIETAESPADLWRGFKLSAAEAVVLIRSLTAKRLTIPANVAGWEWGTASAQARAMAGELGNGWNVTLHVKGASKAIDIQALRPGKPGFVYVGGTEFKVEAFTQDPATRTIRITLSES
jgi:hypothetical protein